MDEIKKAMLGDKEAQREVTDRWELLPCPHCGNQAFLFVEDGIRVMCGKCGCQTIMMNDYRNLDGSTSNATKRVIEKWNTRPQILTAEELERLEKLEG